MGERACKFAERGNTGEMSQFLTIAVQFKPRCCIIWGTGSMQTGSAKIGAFVVSRLWSMPECHLRLRSGWNGSDWGALQ